MPYIKPHTQNSVQPDVEQPLSPISDYTQKYLLPNFDIYEGIVTLKAYSSSNPCAIRINQDLAVTPREATIFCPSAFLLLFPAEQIAGVSHELGHFTQSRSILLKKILGRKIMKNTKKTSREAAGIKQLSHATEYGADLLAAGNGGELVSSALIYFLYNQSELPLKFSSDTHPSILQRIRILQTINWLQNFEHQHAANILLQMPIIHQQQAIRKQNNS